MLYFWLWTFVDLSVSCYAILEDCPYLCYYQHYFHLCYLASVHVGHLLALLTSRFIYNGRCGEMFRLSS